MVMQTQRDRNAQWLAGGVMATASWVRTEKGNWDSSSINHSLVHGSTSVNSALITELHKIAIPGDAGQSVWLPILLWELFLNSKVVSILKVSLKYWGKTNEAWSLIVSVSVCVSLCLSISVWLCLSVPVFLYMSFCFCLSLYLSLSPALFPICSHILSFTLCFLLCSAPLFSNSFFWPCSFTTFSLFSGIFQMPLALLSFLQ